MTNPEPDHHAVAVQVLLYRKRYRFLYTKPFSICYISPLSCSPLKYLLLRAGAVAQFQRGNLRQPDSLRLVNWYCSMVMISLRFNTSGTQSPAGAPILSVPKKDGGLVFVYKFNDNSYHLRCKAQKGHIDIKRIPTRTCQQKSLTPAPCRPHFMHY